LIVVRELAALRDAIAARPGPWALAATMGALHAGHVSLIAAGRQRAAHVAASIFVNPTQFAAHEDLSRYPRDEAGDLAKLEAAGCDLAWLPSVETMYPPGDGTFIDVSGPSAGYEGTMRPGHFRGMATVVGKLLHQVGPAFAMFGEKDWQQLQVVRRMVTDLHFPVAIVGVPTMREPDGLAMSSRNRFLTPAEREMAPILSATLRRTAAALARGQGDAMAVGEAALQEAGFGVDYFAHVDGASLAAPGAGPTRLITAARLGSVRLLDNVAVG
jgi:pantoate--beta-alanine ligase